MNLLPDLSQAYVAVLRFAKAPLQDELKDELDSSAELENDCRRFQSSLDALGAAIETADRNAVAGAFIELRIASMNVASSFDNLAEAIAHLFEDGSVGMGGNSGD